MFGLASAIIGGISVIGGSIHRGVERKRQRKAERQKLEAQRANLVEIQKYKNQMYDYQKESLQHQFEQGQKALNMARSVTEANQQTALRQGAEANWIQTQQMNSQMKNLAMQGADEVGSASQRASLSGFRGSGSVNNLEKKQSDMVASAKNDMQNQISFARYQNMANSANAYSQSNAQLAQYANEKLAQQQNKIDTENQMQLQNDFENQQYDAQIKQIDETHKYLGDYKNFWLNDFIDFAGASVSAGLQIGGVFENNKQYEENKQFMADEGLLNRMAQYEIAEMGRTAQAETNATNRANQASEAQKDRDNSYTMADNSFNNQMNILDIQNQMNMDIAVHNFKLQNDPTYRKRYMSHYGLGSVR